jgi:hypothetical protein
VDELQSREFLAEVQRIDPDIIDLEGAITFALDEVQNHDDLQWFGAIGNGAFYMDFERCLWYEDTLPGEAIGCLKAEFGESLTTNLSYL